MKFKIGKILNGQKVIKKVIEASTYEEACSLANDYLIEEENIYIEPEDVLRIKDTYTVKVICNNCNYAWEVDVAKKLRIYDTPTGTYIARDDVYNHGTEKVECPSCLCKLDVRRQRDS